MRLFLLLAMAKPYSSELLLKWIKRPNRFNSSHFQMKGMNYAGELLEGIRNKAETVAILISQFLPIKSVKLKFENNYMDTIIFGIHAPYFVSWCCCNTIKSSHFQVIVRLW